MVEEQVGASNRYRHIEQPVPERNLHHAKNAGDGQIGANVFWELLARAAQELLKFGQFLPDKEDGSSYLRREQQPIGCVQAGLLSLFAFFSQWYQPVRTMKPARQNQELAAQSPC
jgi:hypothetical protein